MNLSHPQSDYLLMIVWCIAQSLATPRDAEQLQGDLIISVYGLKNGR